MILKRAFPLFAAFLAVPAVALAAVASNPATNRAGRTDVGFNVAGVFSDENDLDDSVFLTGSVAHGLNEWLALGFEVGWAERNLSDDDLTAIPLLVDLIVRVPNESAVVPYGVGGVGAIVWDVEDDDLDDLEDIDASFAAKLGGGIDWFLNERWIVNVEAAYVFTDEDIEITSGSRSVELDYWTVGGGLKYLF